MKLRPREEPCSTGQRHRFILTQRTILFLRGKTICECKSAGTGLIEAIAVQPLPAHVVGKLFRYGRRPLDGEIVTIKIEGGPASTVDVDGGNEVVTLELAGGASGLSTKKKVLFWHGSAADLGGAAWDDVALVNVSSSGDTPFQLFVTATCLGAEARLGMMDVLINDPDSPGWRTARYGLFRTRTPDLKIVTPNLPAASLKVSLDDGEEDTDDELDITALAKLSGDVTAVSGIAAWVRLGGVVSGVTNKEKGRRRLYQESIEAKPEQGDCALFMYGENRLQLKQGGDLVFCAHSFHYLRDEETVPSGRYDPQTITIAGQQSEVVKNSLTLDFTADTNDEGVSRTLHALRLPPRSFAGTFNIVEGRAHSEQTGEALLALRDKIAAFEEPALESVSVTPLTVLGRIETGVLEAIPEALHADFVVANHTFTNRDTHWHHFVIHTFPAHRLIEAQLFPDRRPPQVALSGVNFDTNKTFILPSGAADIRRIRELNDEEPTRKIAIFGHTDRVDSQAHNNQLSLSRARSLNALLRHQIGFWFNRFRKHTEVLPDKTREVQWALKELGDYAGPIDGNDTPAFQTAVAAYRARKPLPGVGVNLTLLQSLSGDIRTQIGAANEALTNESEWGTREIQHMLKQLGHYTGPITGINDTATKEAVKAEQRANNLTDDGDVGLATRVVLIRDYMRNLLAAPIPADRFHANAVFGCGEDFPKIPTPDGVESAQNRRVEAVFRKTPINPINPALLGAAVPYREWLAPEFEEGEAPGIPNVVVAITDTGFGRGTDNLSGEQLTQPNDMLIKGERWVKPTSVRGIAAGNANIAPVSVDGDLRTVADVPAPPLTRAAGQMGHGSACATCMAADGIGAQVAGAARGALNTVIGTAPHIKVRPIADPINLFTMLLTLEIIASDPDVLVYSTSVGFTNGFAATLPFPTAANIRALQQRTQEVVMQGKVIVCLAHNHNPVTPGFAGFYHTGRTQWGSFGPDRRNARSTNAGANVHRQRILVVGNSARVGTGVNALITTPGVREDLANSSLIGETVGVQMPGSDIRSLLPDVAGMGMSNAAVVDPALPAPQRTRIGGATGTSFATPMTAGVVGELMLLDPALRQPANVARVLEYVEATADPMQNTPPGGGNLPAPNTRVNDPIIGGAAGHPAFSNIRRVHYWKAVLAALNKGLSNEGRGANGATDGHFTLCTLRDDSATVWYGFELRSWIADAVLWFRKPTGEFVLAQDAGALFPNDRVTATAWRNVDAFQLAANQPLPAFPWRAADFPAPPAGPNPPVRPLFLCQISIEKARLQNFQALVLHHPSIDPRDPEGAEGPPVAEIRVDNRPTLRNPGAAGGAIAALVTLFDDFVFHVNAEPQAFARFQFFVENNRTGTSVGETIGIRIWAVDAFGHMTRPPAGALTLSHNGTPGAAPATGVFINGAAAPAAGTALAFGAGTDPRSLARIRFQGNTAETVTLSVAGHPGNVAIVVAAPGALADLLLEIRRPGAGADVITSPPRTAEQLELVVRAVDAQGRRITTFADEVVLSLASGQPGTNGPPKGGVHIKATEAAPFNAAAFRHRFTTTGATPDNGEHVFTFFNYTAGVVQFRATSGAIQGLSRDVQFGGGALARLQVDATTPQTVGNEFNVVVTAMDSADNRIDNFEGAVVLSTVPGKGGAPVLGPPRTGVFIGSTSIPGDDTYTFVHTDGGVHQFPVTCHTAETVQFRATSGAIVGNSRDVVVRAAGALARFRFEPRGADRAGLRFELRVIAEDASGRQITNFAGTVTLTLVAGTAFAAAPPPQRGVLFETAPGVAGAAHTYVAADGGAFTFFVTPHTAETINIRATSGGITSDTGNIVIEGGVFDHFRVVPAAARAAVPFNVVVTAQDAFNNTSPHFLGSVSLQLRIGGGAFAAIPGATHVFVDSDNSQFTFSVTLPTSGPGRQIQATDGNTVAQPSAVFAVAP